MANSPATLTSILVALPVAVGDAVALVLVLVLVLIVVGVVVVPGAVCEVSGSDEAADVGKLSDMLVDARLQNDCARVSAEESSVGQLELMQATITPGNTLLGQ